MQPNPIPIVAAAFIPLVVGFLWYHERGFGAAWNRGSGLAPEILSRGPKPVVFLIAFGLSLLVSVGLVGAVIHQSAVVSLFVNQEGFGDPASPVHQQFAALMDQLEGRHRTFGHGALHGALVGLLLAFPVLATNGMFERRSWRFNLINAGYWLVTLALMGGVICRFA